MLGLEEKYELVSFLVIDGQDTVGYMVRGYGVCGGDRQEQEHPSAVAGFRSPVWERDLKGTSSPLGTGSNAMVTRF